MTSIHVACEYDIHLNFDHEPNACLVFYVSNSANASEKRFIHCIDAKKPQSNCMIQLDIRPNTNIAELCFFADLFADTYATTGDEPKGPRVACRRFVARSIWTWMCLVKGESIDSSDMLKGQKNFFLCFFLSLTLFYQITLNFH